MLRKNEVEELFLLFVWFGHLQRRMTEHPKEYSFMSSFYCYLGTYFKLTKAIFLRKLVLSPICGFFLIIFWLFFTLLVPDITIHTKK